MPELDTLSLAACIGEAVDTLDTPAVLVDLDIMERNVARMAAFAAEHGIALRPHAKSHKTELIAQRQRAAGARGLTVAKLDEAEAYLGAGFNDLLVANQVVGVDKWQRLAAMQHRGTVTVGIDNAEIAEGMAAVAQREHVTLPVLIEVDCGLGRAGVQPGAAALALAERVMHLNGLTLRGLFTHAGHAYGARDVAEVGRIGLAEGEILVETAELLRRSGVECEVVSVGSTPTALYAGAVPGVTELRSGNYVFYDRMQVALGAARPEDCSLTVLARVISRPDERRIVIDAGSKTFALDRGAHGLDALGGYGETAAQHLILERLSEEHGMLSFDPSDAPVEIGDRLRFVPNHACTVANLAEALLGVRNGRVTDVLPILVRGGGR